ncbi:hypothetical protein BJX99DRAFT_257373 [Aspergillus californicus]
MVPRRGYLIQNGRPTRVTGLDSVREIASAGEYAVWSSSSHYAGDRIYWQKFSRSKQGRTRPANYLSSNQFFESFNRLVRVQHLSINEDGMFLMILRTHGIQDVERDIVYSSAERKVLWSGDLISFYDHEKSTPVGIGKDSVYCVKQHRDGYAVSAYNFRSGELLYDSLKYASTGDRPRFFGELRKRCHCSFHIFRIAGGKELIVASGIID